MKIPVNAVSSTRTNDAKFITSRPDECPQCHYAIELTDSFFASFNERNHTLQIVHRCPRLSCLSVFIANYSLHRGGGYFELFNTAPKKHAPIKFSDTIKNVSSEFCEIFNQALASEQQGNLKICGVGYRKALEFLIKDYLIGQHPQASEEIKKTLLGKCIDQYVSNENIKAIAKRAVWLGNDETHYVRLWEGKDLQDLKGLVNLTVHWIEMEQLTANVMKDMPGK